jgi:hypothetical protein
MPDCAYNSTGSWNEDPEPSNSTHSRKKGFASTISQAAVGLMFALSLNRFVGSYLFFS